MRESEIDVTQDIVTELFPRLRQTRPTTTQQLIRSKTLSRRWLHHYQHLQSTDASMSANIAHLQQCANHWVRSRAGRTD